MGLTGQQTTLAVTKLLAGLTQGYMEGMKLVREEHARLGRFQLAKDREQRVAAAEKQRAGLAERKFAASEEDRLERKIQRNQQMGVTKKRGRLLDLDIKKRQKELSFMDPQLGNIAERIDTNYKNYLSSKKAREDAEISYRMARNEWEQIKDSSDKESEKYKRVKTRWHNVQRDIGTMDERLANLTRQRDYLTSAKALYTTVSYRGVVRRMHNVLENAGYRPKMAQRFMVDLNLAAIANTKGQSEFLDKLLEQVRLDKIPIDKKAKITKMITRFVEDVQVNADRGITTEPSPYIQHYQEKQTALQELISAPKDEELEFEEAIARKAFEKEGLLPEDIEGDPEALEAIERQKEVYRRLYSTKPVAEPILMKRLSPLARKRLEDAKKKLEGAKKSKKDIKESPYWSRFQKAQMTD